MTTIVDFTYLSTVFRNEQQTWNFVRGTKQSKGRPTNPKDWSTALMKQVLPRFLSPTKFLSCFWLISFRAFLASEGRFSTPLEPSTDKDLLRLLPVSDFVTESLDSSPPLMMEPLQTLPPSLLPPTPSLSLLLLFSIKTLRIWFNFSDGVSLTTKSSQE